MTFNTDVIIIGAGGGGPVIAKELGELGIKVLMLEAGPWYGNKKWPNANQAPGSISSSNLEDLDINLLKKDFNSLENNMTDPITGKFRFGPANRTRSPWFSNLPQNGFIWQCSGVGGSTQYYFANSPRAYSKSINNLWPISYKELIPYYEKVEGILPVRPAPNTAKEELFYYGAKEAGWSLIKTFNPTNPGYRPQPNAILQPDSRIKNSDFDFGNAEGCVLCGSCCYGCNKGPSTSKVAKRSTSVSYVPLALKTGNVDIRPNVFVTKILTENHPVEGNQAIGVQFRDTWSGEITELRAKAIVLAAGAIESPRLWLNSKLPNNKWVGKGLTNHWFDLISGIFDAKDLNNILGIPYVNQHLGQNSAARFDYPGLGMMQLTGLKPAAFSALAYGFSQAGYNFMGKRDSNAPWDIHGRVVGVQLKELMANYRRTLSIQIMTDDEPNLQNGVTLNPILKDEHGLIPVIRYSPSKKAAQKRDYLAKLAADILKKAGAKKIIRSDWPAGLLIHMHSTMRMGYVTDLNCETHQVKRLFIGDNSVLYNGLGGVNPTLTTQALATRTAEKLAQKYFS